MLDSHSLPLELNPFWLHPYIAMYKHMVKFIDTHMGIHMHMDEAIKGFL